MSTQRSAAESAAEIRTRHGLPRMDRLSVDVIFDECVRLVELLAAAGAIADLDVLARAINDRHLPAAVALCREYGTPWAEVGLQLGTSRQAAQQRFSG